MTTPTFYVVLPIFNRSVLPNFSIPWVISEDIVFRNWEDSEKRLFTEESSLIFPNDEICDVVFQLSLPDDFDDSIKTIQKVEDEIKISALCLQTVFNIVAKDETMIIPYAVLIEKGTIQKLSRVIDFDMDLVTSELKSYSTLITITMQEIQQLIKLSKNIIKSDTTLKITFRRFCSAFIKSNWEDRLIDLTIALESLIPSQAEVTFQFSLYLSLIASNDLDTRKETYKLLHDLYKARSGIVHGTSGDKYIKNAISHSRQNWKKLVDIAKQCILSRIEFKDQNPSADWTEYLRNICLGSNRLN